MGYLPVLRLRRHNGKGVEDSRISLTRPIRLSRHYPGLRVLPPPPISKNGSSTALGVGVGNSLSRILRLWLAFFTNALPNVKGICSWDLPTEFPIYRYPDREGVCLLSRFQSMSGKDGRHCVNRGRNKMGEPNPACAHSSTLAPPTSQETTQSATSRCLNFWSY